MRQLHDVSFSCPRCCHRQHDHSNTILDLVHKAQLYDRYLMAFMSRRRRLLRDALIARELVHQGRYEAAKSLLQPFMVRGKRAYLITAWVPSLSTMLSSHGCIVP